MNISFRLISVVLMMTFLLVSCENNKEPVSDIPLGQDAPQQGQSQQGSSNQGQPPESIPEKAMDNILDQAKALPDKSTGNPETSQPEKSPADQAGRVEAGDKSGAKTADAHGAGGISDAKAEKSPHGAKKQGDKHKHQVVVSEEIKNRWEAVRLLIADKQTKKTQLAVVALGGSYRIPGSELQIKTGDFIPDFKVDALSVTSASSKPNNPAVSITIFEDDKVIFDGWLFEKYPEVHSFEHPRYAVALKEGVERSVKPAKIFKDEKDVKPSSAVKKSDEKTERRQGR